MKRITPILLLLVLSLIIVACDSQTNNTNEDTEIYSTESSDIAINNKAEDSTEIETEQEESTIDMPTDRMIIHQAELNIHVKSIEKSLLSIEEEINKYKGYIIESNIYKTDEENTSGHITIRVPEEHFKTILKSTEETATEVLERIVTGQDITEEYIDLESRLSSKKVVETRLLEFMKKAEKTEDLLKISNDLAKVQEEIEVIVGKMKYFENQVGYSTINISMYEDNVTIPGVDSKDLDTWEKTKKQLATSLNVILATGSGFFIFVIGNIPIIFILLLISGGVYWFVKRRRFSK